MADSNSTANKGVDIFSEIQTTAIDELFNIRALALAGEAMAFDGDDNMLNMGRVMKKIADSAMCLIKEIDVVLPSGGAQNLPTTESRAGAMACMDALRIIDRIAAGDKSEATLEECWQDEDVSIKAMQHAAGNHGGFMAGFVAVFAEYAHMFIAFGEPNLYVWKPKDSMTKEEKAAHRAEFTKRVEEGEKIAA